MSTHVIKVDKRILNTKREIFAAFERNLRGKKYNDITIQDILDDSKVSRSTFYSHFKTKEDLLTNISDEIFHHVFSHTLEEELSHDFSKSSIFDYKHLITHIFYHIHDERSIVEAILSNQCKDIFLDLLKDEINEFCTALVNNHFLKEKDIPDELRIYHVINSFVLLLEYWVKNNFKETPELLTEYFIALNN